MKAVAITGRRPEALPWGEDEYTTRAVALKNRLKYRISDLVDRGYKTFYVGMARGVDTYVAEILFEMQSSYDSDIKVIAVVPYKGFADSWRDRDRQRYYDYLALADRVETMNEEYSLSSIFVRNAYMVDNADILLAVYDNVKNGGTYNTLMYAKSKNKEIIIEEI